MIYNGILEVISNSKSLQWYNTFRNTKIQVREWKIDLAQRSVSVNDIEVSLINTEFEISIKVFYHLRTESEI